MTNNTHNISNQPIAQQVIVQDYFNLVRAVATKIKRRLPTHVDVEDLIQTGMIGLLEASTRFDASRKVEFSSYATTRITGAILDELRRADTCSRQDRKTGRAIENAKFNLRTAGCQEPSSEEIAQAVGMGLAEYEQARQRLDCGQQSLSRMDDAGVDEVNELNQIPAKDESAFDICCKGETARILRSRIAQLPSRLRTVVKLYYFEEMQLKEIGQRLGVGEARISQILKQAGEELRRLMNAEKRTPARNVSTMVQ
ncbi:MAG TPA: RNA polymerase sigma factor FliA [Candidatus Angelobacter sp.]|jgi:RNA polymerase sigma factor for flagellar operon FliA|nr:RNA polymerase sigma factor FliA [Candidatus Angelobacter sp.]